MKRTVEEWGKILQSLKQPLYKDDKLMTEYLEDLAELAIK